MRMQDENLTEKNEEWRNSMKKWFTKTVGKLLFYKEKIEMFNQEIRKSKESHLVNTLSCGFFFRSP